MFWLIPLESGAQLLMYATPEEHEKFLAGDENALFTAWKLQVKGGKLVVTT